MDKNNWFVIMILTFLASYIPAQDVRKYEMRGTVVNDINQEPLIGATCSIDKYEHLPSVTGKDGAFRIEGIDLGSQTNSINHSGNKNYAIVNQDFLFPDFEFVSKSEGRNPVLDLTLERFLNNNCYYIFTRSIFYSEYNTPPFNWTNTLHNAIRSLGATVGKCIAGKQKRNLGDLNLKNAWVGGQWDSPLGKTDSRIAKELVRDENNSFTAQLKDFYKFGVGVKYKRNRNHFMSTLSLNWMNSTNNRNVGSITYDINNDKITEWL